MSSWTPAGNDFTFGTGIGQPREVLHPLVHAYIGISRMERQAMPEGNRAAPTVGTELRGPPVPQSGLLPRNVPACGGSRCKLLAWLRTKADATQRPS